MKIPAKSARFILPLLVSATWLGHCPSARAEDPADAPKWEVIAECQMIVVPQKVILPMLSDLGDDEKIEPAFAGLQKMIEQGEATLAANLVARGIENKDLSAESAEEHRYPTEYNPPQLPSELPKEKAAETLKAWPVVGITPTAFETRKVGTSLEISAIVSKDGRWIAATVTPQHVRLLRNTKFNAGILASGDHLFVEQPLFTTLKNTCALQAHTDQRLLIGVHKVPGEENVMELFFLRMRTQKTGTGQ